MPKVIKCPPCTSLAIIIGFICLRLGRLVWTLFAGFATKIAIVEFLVISMELDYVLPLSSKVMRMSMYIPFIYRSCYLKVLFLISSTF